MTQICELEGSESRPTETPQKEADSFRRVSFNNIVLFLAEFGFTHLHMFLTFWIPYVPTESIQNIIDQQKLR